jgi:hypothetical protein
VQLAFHSKRFNFVLLTGTDAGGGSEDEPETFVQLGGADLTIAPLEEVTYYEEEDRAKGLFGFQQR